MRISDWSSDVCSSDLAVVGSDVAIMFGAACIVGPGELNADSRAGIRDFLQIFRLAIPVEFVFDGDDMHSDCILGAMKFADGFHQLHQVAELVEQDRKSVV